MKGREIDKLKLASKSEDLMGIGHFSASYGLAERTSSTPPEASFTKLVFMFIRPHASLHYAHSRIIIAMSFSPHRTV
jgi:hypothetical protein